MNLGVLRSALTHRLAMILLWTGLVVLAAIAVNLVGIRVVGDAQDWRLWLDRHAGVFLVWRLCLYGVTAWGWWWMRQRLRRRDGSPETHARLMRTEVAAVLAIVLLEGSVLLPAP
ncbi:hypothetical protein [Billgrantia endophytica]|uniref:Uncharacterized protein n=1 Tax=Billgrantia endophytica TaxID=2033802 RepID=A0A2N7U4B8_9GAMM|nr:hypothetical protein [Halomonas endophytica]PMR75285.1 hypothetical protein C1H69_10185 [Halomonas endophytica]